MLQQTQVERVIPKYRDFIRRFPDFASLASAPVAEVLRVWQGLGYNRRALYLKRLSEIVEREYNGTLPRDAALLQRLPGIGKGTAGAIRAFAFDQPSAFIETNVRRVFIHSFFQREAASVSDSHIMPLIERMLDRRRPREWYYALMDCGAALAKTVSENPNRKSKQYHRQSSFIGSRRQLRGQIVRVLIEKGSLSEKTVERDFLFPKATILEILDSLETEGIVRRIRQKVVLVE